MILANEIIFKLGPTFSRIFAGCLRGVVPASPQSKQLSNQSLHPLHWQASRVSGISAYSQHLQSMCLMYRSRNAEMPLVRTDFDNAAVANIQNPSPFRYHHGKHYLCICYAVTAYAS